MNLYPAINGFDEHAAVVPETEADATKFIATVLVVRALRAAGLQHALVGAPCAIGITGVDPSIGETVTDAARDLLKKVGKDRYGFATVVNDHTGRRQRPTATLEGLIDTLQTGVRLCCIFTGDENVPAAFRIVAEGIAVLPQVDADLVRVACLRTVGKAPSRRELTALGELPLPLLSVALMNGRSVAQGLALARRLHAAQLQVDTEEIAEATVVPATPPGPRLEELHGLGEAGEWGRSLAADLADYRDGLIGWSDVDRGALVSGPPGTGKTTFVLALGRSCNVPVHVHSFARWQANGYLNEMLKAMRGSFTAALAAAPCILFIDEVDAVGDRARTGDHNASYQTQVINCFLECLDGAETRTGVVVVGATNNRDMIDPAVRRPGRLDRDIKIPLPDARARSGILRFHLKGALPDTDLAEVAARLEGFSGADIEQTVRNARRHARRSRRPMVLADLEGSLPPMVRVSDNLFRRMCIHEAGHAIVGLALAAEAGLVTVSARVAREVSSGSAAFTEFRRQDGFDRTRASFVAEIAILMAGIAAEESVLGSKGDGAGGGVGSDLQRATEIATVMQTSLGMGSDLTHVANGESPFGHPPLIQQGPVRAGVGGIVAEGYERARTVVGERRHEVLAVASELALNGSWNVESCRPLTGLNPAQPNGNKC